MACAELDRPAPATPESRSVTTSASATSTTRRRRVPPALRRRRRPGLRPPVGHDGQSTPDRWMAQWLTGMPAETHLSILALILGGVFDRVPDTEDLLRPWRWKLSLLARPAENAWHNEVTRARPLGHPPSHYTTGSWSTAWSSTRRAAPARRRDGGGQGHARQRLPLSAGGAASGQVVRDAEFLTAEQRAKLLSGNALRFLGLT